MSDDYSRKLEEQMRRYRMVVSPMEQQIRDKVSLQQADTNRLLREQEARSRLVSFDDAAKELVNRATFDLESGWTNWSDQIHAQRRFEEQRRLAAQLVGQRGLEDTNPKQYHWLLERTEQQLNKFGLSIEDAVRGYNDRFALVDEDELNAIGKEAFARSRLARAVFPSSEEAVRVLESIKSPWALVDDPVTSASAVLELMAIGRGIASIGPYDPEFSAHLRGIIGDWHEPIDAGADPEDDEEDEEERGGEQDQEGKEEQADPPELATASVEYRLDQSLTDFTTEAFAEIIKRAGLDALSAELVRDDRAPVDEDGYPPPETERSRQAFSIKASPIVLDAEIRLRRFIRVSMNAKYGENWLKSRHGALRVKMVERRQIEIGKGRTPRPIFEYADLPDLGEIIIQDANWKEIFKPVFSQREGIQASLQRLYPLRNIVAHSGSFLGLGGYLEILVETRRINEALNRVGG